MKLNRRLSNLLLLIQIAKIYGDSDDLYGNWNSWSPCPAKCMSVFRTRERFCISKECFITQILYKQEMEDCKIPTCVKPPSSLDTLDGCIEKQGNTIGLKLENRNIPESQKTLSLDFGMEFPIIHVVIKVTRGFQGMKLRYTLSTRPDVWYTYLNKPLRYKKGKHIFFRGANTYQHDVNITIGFFTVRKLEITLLQSPLVSSMEEKTWAALVWGCTRERYNLKFDDDSANIWLNEPSKAVVANFVCRTNATRFYAEGMRIRNRITSKEVSFNSAKPLHVKVLQKTTNIYRGWNVISVNLNYPNADALVGDFNKIVYNGVAHYYGVFECTGKTELIEGDEYGMFRSGHIEVMFSADINECLMFDNCSTHAQCINTIGSFYCKCHPGYFGNGFSCYSREDWITNKRGVYTTSELEYIEFYDRALFYAKITKQLFVCGRYKVNPNYGCLVSIDFGDSWETTHPRLDLILGQSNNTDVLYGYSTQDSAYVMLFKKKWYSITQSTYYSARNQPDYQHIKVIMPVTSNSDQRRNEEIYPLQSGQINVLGTLLGVTEKGILKRMVIDVTSVSWSPVFYWSSLPLN